MEIQAKLITLSMDHIVARILQVFKNDNLEKIVHNRFIEEQEEEEEEKV